DLTLVRGDLRSAADAIRLSRRTLGTIKGNLFWAFAYNVAAIPLAALGLLNPMLAGAAMAFSSVFVVGNRLRLRSFRSRPLHGPPRTDRSRSRTLPEETHDHRRDLTHRQLRDRRGQGAPPRLHLRQGPLPRTAQAHRGPGARAAPHGGRGEVLHRHPHPDQRP